MKKQWEDEISRCGLQDFRREGILNDHMAQPIHKLITVIPVKEQDMEEEEEDVGSEQQVRAGRKDSFSGQTSTAHAGGDVEINPKKEEEMQEEPSARLKSIGEKHNEDRVTVETEVKKASTKDIENRTSLHMKGNVHCLKVHTDFWGLSYEIFESRGREEDGAAS
jgi:hypothetical protein